MRIIWTTALVAAALGFVDARAEERGLPTRAFVATWTAMPVLHFVADDAPAPKVVDVAARPTESVPAGLVDDAIASARDEHARRDLTLLETDADWSQASRTALEDAREAQVRYAALARASEASDTGFLVAVRQIADGAVRSAAQDGAVSAPTRDEISAAFAAALDKAPVAARDRLRDAQTAWLAYREAMMSLAAAKAPGLVAQVRSEIDAARLADLADR